MSIETGTEKPNGIDAKRPDDTVVRLMSLAGPRVEIPDDIEDRTHQGEAMLFTWLCQICRSELTTVFEERGPRDGRILPLEDDPVIRTALESISIESDTPGKERTREELERLVCLTLDYLPTRFATTLEMKYIRGRNIDEIGAHLDISSRAAESVLGQAQAAFREGFRSLWYFEPDFLSD